MIKTQLAFNISSYFAFLVALIITVHSALGQGIPDIVDVENVTDPELDFARRNDSIKITFADQLDSLHHLRLQINGVKYKKFAPLKIARDKDWIIYQLAEIIKPNPWDDLFKNNEYQTRITIEITEKDGNKVTDNWLYYILQDREKPTIKEVYGHSRTEETNKIRFDDRVVVALSNMNFNADITNQDLILYINDRPFDDITADVNQEESKLYFSLIKDLQQQEDPWDLFFKGKSSGSVDFSVGFKKGQTTPSQNVEITFFKPSSKTWAIISVVITVLLIIIFGIIFRDVLIFRVVGTNRPFSYSKLQLYAWVTIIISSVVYILILTGDLYSLSTSSLALLTISGTTTFLGILLDKFDKGKDGLTIPRFQGIIFNLVFAIYFIYIVYTRLEMPEFSETQLILLGISSTTYATLKYVESP